MSSQPLRMNGERHGIGQGFNRDNGITRHHHIEEEAPAATAPRLVLENKARLSKSPYVRAHAANPVAWQIWGDEAIGLAKRENRLLFLSIGYSACHWCHVMERESFENEDVAAILNDAFIPVKVDREERPDIDRIYMNFVQATTGSGGWPLNVFVTPDLEPVFGGTYWPGPNSATSASEDQVDFLGILNKLSTVWEEQEERCRQDSAQILQQLKNFAAEGTHGDRLGGGSDGLDLELLEEAYERFASSFDKVNGGFGSAPKFPTPSKLSFLLRLSQYPPVVQDVVGPQECQQAQSMAITTLRKMARGGIHDHIGNGFARYSVTADWSLPHFEKMLYDNAQLLHVYLDAFLVSRDPELLGVVYDISTYLTTTLAHPAGGFFSSEDADSYYRNSDSEKREGAYYVWTKREFVSVLGSQKEAILSAFFNVSGDGNVLPENDAHDEFLDQNVLSIVTTPSALAGTFGMKEEEIVEVIKEGKAALLARRQRERVRPQLDDKMVVSWNGIALGGLARAGAALRSFDLERGEAYLAAATQAARFIKGHLYDEERRVLWRVWREGRGETEGFADDYAFLIEGLIDLFEVTGGEEWLRWADELQATQLSLFFDLPPTPMPSTTPAPQPSPYPPARPGSAATSPKATGGFFSTAQSAAHVILRLKDGMDTSEPSTNGTSACNLYRLAHLLRDERYRLRGRQTVESFEAEMLQYPWLFGSFMPAIVEAVAAGMAAPGGIDDVERGEDVIQRGEDGLEPTQNTPLTAPRRGLTAGLKPVDARAAWLQTRTGSSVGIAGNPATAVAEHSSAAAAGTPSTPPAPTPVTHERVAGSSSGASGVPPSSISGLTAGFASRMMCTDEMCMMGEEEEEEEEEEGAISRVRRLDIAGE